MFFLVIYKLYECVDVKNGAIFTFLRPFLLLKPSFSAFLKNFKLYSFVFESSIHIQNVSLAFLLLSLHLHLLPGYMSSAQLHVLLLWFVIC